MSVKIPKNIGSGGSHMSAFSRSGGLAAIFESIVFDLETIAIEYNAHDHGGNVANSPTAAGEDVTLGTQFGEA